MRNYIKKQLIELAKNLYSVHDAIKTEIEAQNHEQMIGLLTECQAVAIHIGNTIEENEGEGIKVVSNLEEYCETIYQVSIAKDDSSCLTKFSLLNQLIDQILEGIRSEIKVAYNVVFIPYKASMWDSLESIWQAAKQDTDCNVYVIPVPYFERNSDGGFGEIHYEADLFPEYVPLTDYQSYDLVAQKPDVIYFHNPYDQYNFVTSVHPAFYSSELKKYTNMLVYVPYFVNSGVVPKHLCEVIGIFNADRVIVQSEEEKELYSCSFIDLMGDKQKKLEQQTGQIDYHFWNQLKSIADKKFLPLGSPKFDKVLNTNLDVIDIPKEWKRTMYYKNGERKKIILYNTTIDSLIKNKEKILNKIKNTLSVFSKNKDVVLLWRPHPLSEATLKTMRPDLLHEYLSIVHKYKQDGWGIYDDTAELNRAIAISDAYYGDGSSVVALFKKTGRPIMLQNVEVLS